MSQIIGEMIISHKGLKAEFFKTFKIKAGGETREIEFKFCRNFESGNKNFKSTEEIGLFQLGSGKVWKREINIIVKPNGSFYVQPTVIMNKDYYLIGFDNERVPEFTRSHHNSAS